MSTAPLIRYPLDPTGLNQDNYVSGEIKTLTTAQLRAIAPKYGPFFTEGFTAYDNGNGRILVKGVDFQIVDLLQSATLKFGKEIAQVVLIINPNVSSSVRINYHVLGGAFQGNAEGLVALYDVIMQDGRPVDWTNVLNKPTQYTPTLHNHMLEDVYGFEPLVVAMERIRNALILSDVPAFEALIDWVKRNNNNTVIVDTVLGSIHRDSTHTFGITTSNNRNKQKYYWKVIHQGTTTDVNFLTTGGEINIFQNRGSFTLKTSGVLPRGKQLFDIEIRKDSVNGPIATTIEGIVYIGIPTELDMAGMLRACCLLDPEVKVTPTSLFIMGDKE